MFACTDKFTSGLERRERHYQPRNKVKPVLSVQNEKLVTVPLFEAVFGKFHRIKSFFTSPCPKFGHTKSSYSLSVEDGKEVLWTYVYFKYRNVKSSLWRDSWACHPTSLWGCLFCQMAHFLIQPTYPIW